MLIGAFGRFWERDLVDWDVRGWQLLGRRGLNTGTLEIADFRRARGVYVLYNEVSVWYVGLASAQQGIGGRLRDHLQDDHEYAWSRFSWFSFDSPSEQRDRHGVRGVDQYGGVDLASTVAIRDMEALLQVALQPLGNRNETRFDVGSEWHQVATATRAVWTFDELRGRLGGKR